MGESIDGPLATAIKRGDVQGTRSLLATGASPTAAISNWEEGWAISPLRLAVESRQYEVARCLLAAGANVAQSEALDAAVANGQWELVREFLAAGADPTEGLWRAIDAQSLNPFVPLLLAAGADPNAKEPQGLTLLCLAAGRDGGAGAIRALIDAGTDVNHRNDDGDTPLMWAAYQREWPRLDVIPMLIAAGADPNALNDQPGVPTTALICATRAGQYGNVVQLLEGGADPNLADAYSNTPLLEAARAGDYGTALRLLEGGADPNLGDAHGNTPILEAARNCDPALLGLLLQHGADATATNQCGESVESLAASRYEALVRTLRSEAHNCRPEAGTSHTGEFL